MNPVPPDPPRLADRLWRDTKGFLFDIGANQGQTLEQAAGRFHSVVCVEPCREAFSVLQATAGRVRDSFESITLLPIAASDHKGEVTLLAHPDKMSSGQLVSRFADFDELSEADHEQRHLPCDTVDNLAEQFGAPDVLKVDVEGHEMRVLRGATRTLRDGVGFIIEVHAKELGEQAWSFLESIGRKDFVVVRHPHHRPGSGFYDEHYWIRSV